MPLPSLTQTAITITFILFNKICKKNLIYLRKYKAKQTFANPVKFGLLYENLFRLYTSYKQAPSTSAFQLTNRKNEN